MVHMYESYSKCSFRTKYEYHNIDFASLFQHVYDNITETLIHIFYSHPVCFFVSILIF